MARPITNDDLAKATEAAAKRTERPDFTPREARAATIGAQRWQEEFERNLLQLYERGAHHALGYKDVTRTTRTRTKGTAWERFVATELELTPGRAARMLKRARARRAKAKSGG